MTKEEVVERYGIPASVLDLYHGMGLCGAVKMTMRDWHYDDTDIARLGTILALHDLGFSQAEIEQYMRLLLAGEATKEERIALVTAKRRETLDAIHLREKQLARMDYLRYAIREGKKEVC